MDKFVLSVSLIFVVIINASCDTETAIDCVSKFFNGTCQNVPDCPYAMSLLHNHDVNTLSELRCDFNKMQPQVCCPQKGEVPILYNTKEEAATNRPTPTTPKLIVTTTMRAQIQEDNVTLDVFPNKTICGKVKDRGVSDRIVGGSVVDLDEHPWLARIQYKYDNEMVFACSASLITNLHLLTAAHCFKNDKLIPISVRLGEWNIKTKVDCRNGICNQNTIDVIMDKVTIHPTFKKITSGDGDIALIQMKEPVTFTEFIQPVCLPTSKYIATQDYGPDSVYWASGWGQTEYETESVLKRQVQLKAVAVEICQNIHNIKPKSIPNIICAGGIKGKDTCRGDSGGPLVKIESENYEENWYLLGITSGGSRICGSEGVPGVYTRVSAYMDWIVENVKA